MAKLKIKSVNLLKGLINDQSGFGLVELLIVLSLLVIVLTMIFTFYLFGVTSFNIGEQQSDVQQNARIAAGFITKELRIAERVIIVNEYEDFAGLDIEQSEDFYLYYIYLEEGSIYYQQFGEVEEHVKIQEGISANIDFELDFKVSASKGNLLQINLSAVEKESNRTYTLETEVLVLNIDLIEDQSDGEGSAIFYQIPAPPKPAISSIILDPESHKYISSGFDINVSIYTRNVSDDQNVSVEFWRLKEGYNDNLITEDSSNIIDDHYAELTLAVPYNLNFGDYYVEVTVDSVSFPQRRYYYIEPKIQIVVDSRPGNPFFGTVTITTGGVPVGTPVIIQLFERDKDTPLVQGVDFNFHNPSNPILGADGKMIFNIKVESPYVGKDLYLTVTIGKTTQSSETFDIVD